MKIISKDLYKTVDYFGNQLTIPANHRYIATDIDGQIYSYYHEPMINIDSDAKWHVSYKLGSWCRVGTAEIGTFDFTESLVSL